MEGRTAGRGILFTVVGALGWVRSILTIPADTKDITALMVPLGETAQVSESFLSFLVGTLVMIPGAYFLGPPLEVTFKRARTEFKNRRRVRDALMAAPIAQVHGLTSLARAGELSKFTAPFVDLGLVGRVTREPDRYQTPKKFRKLIDRTYKKRMEAARRRNQAKTLERVTRLTRDERTVIWCFAQEKPATNLGFLVMDPLRQSVHRLKKDGLLEVKSERQPVRRGPGWEYLLEERLTISPASPETQLLLEQHGIGRRFQRSEVTAVARYRGPTGSGMS